MNRRQLIAGLACLASGTAIAAKPARGDLSETQNLDLSNLPNNELRLLADITLADDGVTILKHYVVIPFVDCDI